MFSGRGQHSLLDFNGCIIPTKNTEAVVLKLNLCFKDICLRNNLRVVGERLVIFDGTESPSGATFCLLLDESHISFHSYGELGICAIDVFTCAKDPINHLKACCEIKRLMGDMFPNGWLSTQQTIPRFVTCEPPEDMLPHGVVPANEHWSGHPVL